MLLLGKVDLSGHVVPWRTKCWTGVAVTVLSRGELTGRDPVNMAVRRSGAPLTVELAVQCRKFG